MPFIVGFSVGLTFGIMKERIESKSRSYERQLSREREDAALGRSAAAIAHEVRNPLNALGMGLQRLQIEANELKPEHQHLVDLMLDAVRRANTIVSGLLAYARPQKPRQRAMRLDLLVKDRLDLYLSRCGELGIRVTQRLDYREPISGDPDLLGQVVDNLIINSIDAQPHGGFLHLELDAGGREVVLKVRNERFFPARIPGKAYPGTLFYHQGQWDRSGSAHCPTYCTGSRRSPGSRSSRGRDGGKLQWFSQSPAVCGNRLPYKEA